MPKVLRLYVATCGLIVAAYTFAAAMGWEWNSAQRGHQAGGQGISSYRGGK